MTEWVKDLLPLCQVAIAFDLAYIALERFRYLDAVDKLYETKIPILIKIIEDSGNNETDSILERARLEYKVYMEKGIGIYFLKSIYGRKKKVNTQWETTGFAFDSIIIQIILLIITFNFLIASIPLFSSWVILFFKYIPYMPVILKDIFYVAAIVGVVLPFLLILGGKSVIYNVNKKLNIYVKELQGIYNPRNPDVQKTAGDIANANANDN
jgi:hypothetical protein